MCHETIEKKVITYQIEVDYPKGREISGAE
jgi:hypothetical protein